MLSTYEILSRISFCLANIMLVWLPPLAGVKLEGCSIDCQFYSYLRKVNYKPFNHLAPAIKIMSIDKYHEVKFRQHSTPKCWITSMSYFRFHWFSEPIDSMLFYLYSNLMSLERKGPPKIFFSFTACLFMSLVYFFQEIKICHEFLRRYL